MTKAEKLQVLKDIADGRVIIDTSPGIYIVESVKGSGIYYVNGLVYSEYELEALREHNKENANVPFFLCVRNYGKHKTKEASDRHREREQRKQRKRYKEQQQQEALNKPQESVIYQSEVVIREEPKQAINEALPVEIPTSGLISEYGRVWRFKDDRRPLNN